MPPGVTGLIPDGSTKVDWRWMGEVFEDSADEILQNSIVVRNLQEAGVGSIEALKYLFPNKTDEERAAMMSGFPFRVVQQTQQAINSFVGMLGNLYQLPHPQTPDLPLASDPNLDLTGFLYRSLDYLRKELSYSGKYKPSSSDDSISSSAMPTSVAPQSAAPSGMSQPAAFQASPTSGPMAAAQASAPAAQAGPGGQPMAGGVPGSERKLEYKQPLPGPGSRTRRTRHRRLNQYPGAAWASQANPAANPVFGSPDLQSPSFNPSLLGIGGAQPSAAAGRKPSAKRTRRK